MSLTSANRDLALLHPEMRARVVSVMAAIDAEGLPLKVFEAWRSPERQRHLYAQGRTRPGNKVTFAQGWESYHQYGLAVDLVGFVGGNWTWDLPAATWKRMHQIGADNGLERLGFETPHLQLAGLDIRALLRGVWPSGGDGTWRENLEESIAGWNGTPAAPPFPTGLGRPALGTTQRGSGADWILTPLPSSSDWHAMFGGQRWRHDGNGVYLENAKTTPLRTPGAPLTVTAILDLYGSAIHKASLDHGVPPELIVMTIATETAFAKKANFTGPTTFRWEAHVPVTDATPNTLGDYSAGPMQTLATTARDIVRRLSLPYAPFVVAPHFATKPASAPGSHPLYEGAPNIDIGTAEIRSRLAKTGFDPILVAAAYNAGGLYQSDQNPWHLRCSNDHLDRAAQWYGDACFVLATLR